MITLHWVADIATANSVQLSGTLDIAHFQAASLKSIFMWNHLLHSVWWEQKHGTASGAGLGE